MALEKWKPVVGYEGLYEVSDQGRVRSLDRIVTRRNGVSYRAHGTVLKPEIPRNGYPTVCLWKENRPHLARIHRLVAEVHVPNPQGKSQVNHIDGNRSHNEASNLEWSTAKENMRHSFRKLGRVGSQRKLDSSAVREIRSSTATQDSLAHKFGVSQRTISLVKRRLIYKEVV